MPLHARLSRSCRRPLTDARHTHARTCTHKASPLPITCPRLVCTTDTTGQTLLCPADAYNTRGTRSTAAHTEHSSTRHARDGMPRAQTPLRVHVTYCGGYTSATCWVLHIHPGYQAHRAAACGKAAQREGDGLIEAVSPRSAAVRGVLEGSEGGRPHRCFPLLACMPLRIPSTAWDQPRQGGQEKLQPAAARARCAQRGISSARAQTRA